MSCHVSLRRAIALSISFQTWVFITGSSTVGDLTAEQFGGIDQDVDLTECGEEPEIDSLEFSLLQTSLEIIHEQPKRAAVVTAATPTAAATSSAEKQHAAVVMGQDEASSTWPVLAKSKHLNGSEPEISSSLNASHDDVFSGFQGFHHHAMSAFLALWGRFGGNSKQGTTAGVPMIVMFMLVFVVGVIFVIQMISIATEPKDAHPPMYGPSYGHSSYSLPPSRGYSRESPPFIKQVPTMSAQPSMRESFASHSPPFPVDRLREVSEFDAASPYEGNHFVHPQSAGFPPPSRPRTDVSVEASHSPDAICPALILPHGEAQFSIPEISLIKLMRGEYPVAILGPSGKPLLHARIPTMTIGGEGHGGHWLELSTTASSRYPHASIGPLRLDPGSVPSAVEIRGPRGDHYGKLQPSGSGWEALHRDRLVLLVRAVPEGLQAISGNNIIAKVTPDSPKGDLKVQVNPGVDALLVLLCMLAVVLMSPELVGMRPRGA